MNMQVKGSTYLKQFFERYKAINSALILAVLTTIAMGANPFQSETVAPLDLLVAQPGWASLELASFNDIVHWQRSDVLDQLLPGWEALRTLIRSGEAPVWLHYAYGGTPGIQLLSLGALSPSFLLYCLAPSSALGIYFAVWLRLFIGMVGMYLFLSRRMEWTASLLGAVTFGLAGYNAAWIFWPQTLTIIWLPWLFWATDGWFEDRSLHWIAAIGFSSAFMILGGFPSLAAFGFYAWALYLAAIAAAETKGLSATQLIKIAKVFLPIGLGVMAGFIICAFPIYSLGKLLSSVDLGYRSTTGSVLNSSIIRLLWQPYAEAPYPDINSAAFFGRPALLLMSFTIGYSLIRIRKSKLARYAILLVIIGLIALGISIGLANGSSIKWLPVFRNNPWHRMLAIFDFFAAAVAALGIHILLTRLREIVLRPAWISILVTLIVAVLSMQYIDQVRYFRKLNAVVPSAWFYPFTPSLRYVKERLNPLNSVIADHGYLVSGTLGAYGIREWFAHGLKTEAEKQLLKQVVNDPFPTPTAARFRGSSIELASSTIPLFGVRFILASDMESILKAHHGEEQRPCPPLTHNYQYQRISIRKNLRPSELRLQLATYRAPAAPADLEIILLDSSNNDINRWYIKKEEVRDNAWINLRFSREKLIRVGDYRLGIRKITSGEEDRKVSVWCQTVPQANEEFAFVDGGRKNLTFKYEFRGEIEKKIDLWTYHRFEPKIQLLERNDGHYGPYLIQSPKAEPSIFLPHAYSNVSASSIIIRAEADINGWLVLPIRLNKDWVASVNGSPALIDYYRNIFPMVPITAGTIEVTFKYRTAYTLVGITISLIGLLSLSVVFLAGYYRKKVDMPLK